MNADGDCKLSITMKNQHKTSKYLGIFLSSICLFIAVHSFAQTQEQAIDTVLNQFHQAAAEADAKIYLNSLTEDAIFLGTDASERWTKQQFTEFVLPYFNQGKGWLYVMKERNISLISNNNVAFFDELLENQKYGYCRGTGVLVLTEQGWKIRQYNLTFLVPNDLATNITEEIKKHEQKK